MSLRSVQTREPDEPKQSGKCIAHGCPLPGSVSHDGSRFLCSHHAWADAEKWQSITRGIREHDWLTGFICDIWPGKLSREWREYATKFWEAVEPYMVLAEYETQVMYLYRLHLSLAHRVGARADAPKILKPAGADLPKRQGTLGAMLDFA